jgi:hypothetical protein
VAARTGARRILTALLISLCLLPAAAVAQSGVKPSEGGRGRAQRGWQGERGVAGPDDNVPVYRPEPEPPRRPRPLAVQSVDPDPTRLVLGPSAVPRRAGRFRWTISDLFLHHLDYGVGEHLQVGMQALLPVLYVGFFPQLKLSARLGDELWGAAYLHGGVFWPYVEPQMLSDQFSGRFALYGAGLLLTKRAGPVLINASVAAYGLHYGQRLTKTIIDDKTGLPTILTRMDYSDYWAVMPGLGLGWQVARRVKLNLEVHAPLGDFADVGKVWLIMYGVRACGRETFFDLSFVMPIYPGLGDIIKFIPLGIPIASVGLQW